MTILATSPSRVLPRSVCGASAVGDSAPGAAYRSALSDDEDDDLSILPPVRANAGTLILG